MRYGARAWRAEAGLAAEGWESRSRMDARQAWVRSACTLPDNYKFLYIPPMTTKPIEFLGDALDSLRSFPVGVRREAGFPADKVQRGGEPDDWKTMRTIGAGVREIRVRDEAGAFRVIYLAKLADAVIVLHCFQKKTEQTSDKDIDLARKRFRELMRKQP